MIEQFLFELIKALLVAAIGILTPVIVLFVQTKAREIKGRLTSTQLVYLQELTVMVVRAAEQSGLAGLILDNPEAKKAYAIGKLQAILDSRHIKIDVAELEVAIEAAIKQGLQHGASAIVDAQLLDVLKQPELNVAQGN